ncbi:MAG: DHA2 family efflux MFS transporter permease subunit [Azospirillaceae bacterium]|nr:DHA2 family efflux MFS transporter permease subunit [Azospirillaceae bacterium]
MTEQVIIHDAAVPAEISVGNPRRWLALGVLCLGVLMIMLDSNIVNVALPSIETDLAFPLTSIAWIVNAYFLFFGGFLLLGGRLGDLYGHRKLFIIGIGVFTLGSFACGVAGTPLFLIAARAAQGFGGAVVTAVALSLIMGLFTEAKERAVAMGVYGFVCASGSGIGAMVGGLLTGGLGWRWIFLINLPIGLAVILLSFRLLSRDHQRPASGGLDIFGALTGTAALMLAVYAIVNGNAWGWASTPIVGCAVLAAILFGVFLVAESRAKSPLMPLGLFRNRNVSAGNVIVMLWAAALFTWFFLSSLYLQFVQGYGPVDVGLAFLPTNLTMALLSLGLSGWTVNKVGIRWSLVSGLALAACGLFLLSRLPVAASFTTDILPGMLLFGVGAGFAVNPMLLAAINGVAENETGLASGVVNTSFAMGGAFWLAVLSSYAAHQTKSLEIAGLEPRVALNGGYQVAFLAAAACCALAAAVGALALRPGRAPG